MLASLIEAAITSFPVDDFIDMFKGNQPTKRPGLEAAADKNAVRRQAPAPYMKRPACATNQCITCPFARDNGSC